MNTTNDTLRLVAEAQKTPLPDDVLRSFTQPGTATTGLMGYDLEAPSKKLYPVLTPLRNRIARRADGFAIQSNWRAVTGINTNSMRLGVAEGKRGGIVAQTTADYLAKFVGCGLENSVSFESDYASKNFEDVKALAVTQLLQSCMIGEEFLDLGGNGTVAIGQTPTPTLADVATGGALAAATAYKVGCVALTLSGYQQVAKVNNGRVGDSVSFATGLTQVIARTNADATTDNINGGTAIISAVASQTTASDGNATHCVSATVTPLAGAVAYAWYWGLSGASTMYLGAVTTINSVLITAAASSANQAYSALTGSQDNSNCALEYDGLLTQIMKSGSGAYFADLATGTAGTGTKLTADGGGGISELNTAFASFWDNYRLSPDEIYVGGQVLLDLNALIIANGGAPLIRYNMDQGGGTLDAGIVVVGTVLNKITNTKVKILVHPNMPPGMLMFFSGSIPYPLNDVGSILLKHLRRDYYQIEWPLRTRKYEYGVYFDGVLKNYFPPAFGVIRNIAPGH